MENENLKEHLKQVEQTLKKTHKKQILTSSFFNEYGEPLSFIKPIIEETRNLTDTFRTMFPYGVQYRASCKKDEAINLVIAEDIWMVFHSEFLFRNENDAKVFGTLLKLLK